MVDIKELLKAGIHFGHRTSRWSPSMKPYIWGAKNKIHLLDVAKTAFLLDRATKFLTEVSSNGGSILWVGTKRAARIAIEATSSKLDQPYVIHRWIGGTLSNFSQVKKAMTRLLHLRDIIAKAEKDGSHYTKKELSMLTKELARLEKNVGGILNLSYPPAAVVVVDALKERAAVHEALRLGIPVVAMVDTNTDPKNINFVIPSNDDAPRSIECILAHLSGAVETGNKVFTKKKNAEKEAAAAKKAEATKAATQPSPKASADAKAMADKTAGTAKPAEAEVKVEAKVEAKPAEKKVEAAPAKKAAPAKEEKPAEKKVEAAPKKEAAPAKEEKPAEKKVEAAPKKEAAPAKEAKPAPKKEAKPSEEKKAPAKKPAAKKPAAKKPAAKKES